MDVDTDQQLGGDQVPLEELIAVNDNDPLDVADAGALEGLSPLVEIRPGSSGLAGEGSGAGGGAAAGGMRHHLGGLGGLIDALGGVGGRPGLLGLSTQAEDMQLLVHAVLNEKNAPELLPFRQQLLDRVEDRLARQEDLCESLEQDMQRELDRMMLTLEVRRVRYLVKLYHRTRLLKIEKMAAALVLDQELMDARLSTHEQAYCRSYFALVGQHVTETVLRSMPEEFRSLCQVHSGGLSEGDDLVPQPLLDSHVFCKLLDDAGSVTIDEATHVDMHAADVFMLKYRPVAHLVANQQAVLI